MKALGSLLPLLLAGCAPIPKATLMRDGVSASAPGGYVEFCARYPTYDRCRSR